MLQMKKDYSKNLLKSYMYWDVYIHENQGYLGRCVIWCKRSNAEDLIEATLEERKELFQILNVLRELIRRTFNADWFNYSFLGNETRHLHCHLVPRYEGKREFMGVLFEDTLYGHNYKTDHTFETSEELLKGIKEELIRNLLN